LKHDLSGSEVRLIRGCFNLSMPVRRAGRNCGDRIASLHRWRLMMTMTSILTGTYRRESRLERVVGGIAAAFDTVSLWEARRCSRKHLAALDDRMLRDIGVSRADVEHEDGKPFWRV
jgi:uncharacterized protein YjiS (DUF1127 family)